MGMFRIADSRFLLVYSGSSLLSSPPSLPLPGWSVADANGPGGEQNSLSKSVDTASPSLVP